MAFGGTGDEGAVEGPAVGERRGAGDENLEGSGIPEIDPLGGWGGADGCGPPLGGWALGLPPPIVLPSVNRRLSGMISRMGLGVS